MNSDWIKKFANIIEDRDTGVVLSGMTLLTGLASHQPTPFEPLIPYVVSILTKLSVDRICPGNLSRSMLLSINDVVLRIQEIIVTIKSLVLGYK